MYLLYTQLGTHKHMFADEVEEEAPLLSTNNNDTNATNATNPTHNNKLLTEHSRRLSLQASIRDLTRHRNPSLRDSIGRNTAREKVSLDTEKLPLKLHIDVEAPPYHVDTRPKAHLNDEGRPSTDRNTTASRSPSVASDWTGSLTPVNDSLKDEEHVITIKPSPRSNREIIGALERAESPLSGHAPLSGPLSGRTSLDLESRLSPHREEEVKDDPVPANKSVDAADTGGEEEEEEDILGVKYALIWLALVTVLIAFLSDALVATIEEAAAGSVVSNEFLTLIVVPIIGNAAEHTSAIIFGAKDRLNISLSIAIGSASQIALFLLPFLVLLGWMANIG